MYKTTFLILAFSLPIVAFSQNGYLVLKKRHRPLRYFWKDSRITFQRNDGEWIHGIITNIHNDSFSLTRESIRYTLSGVDTTHYRGYIFSLKDIYALPTKKEMIVHDNNRVRVILGHEKFVWVRNGFIFQVAGAGYVVLNIANDLIQNEPPFEQEKLKGLAIGSAVFLIGTILHWSFYPHIRIGKKFHLEAVVISGM
ncbi:hypothetical protein A4H97_16005 [Niastella yeongjuensis]|uniref:Uncharacterized protein n=1 Tax=Niastella yeongjuensis TaxID=354355 RepID=A0A1V9E4R1_9BACT|nr:hypothetical protein [Niastella yeongjuensis]OQP41098.1 hypothetical protein A4H97_16005 [Niastella yeongjuensis]SEO92224.1 hypothetical protein SAMN05660816_03848 [Niastella yeongjuensis]